MYPTPSPNSLPDHDSAHFNPPPPEDASRAQDRLERVAILAQRVQDGRSLWCAGDALHPPTSGGHAMRDPLPPAARPNVEEVVLRHVQRFGMGEMDATELARELRLPRNAVQRVVARMRRERTHQDGRAECPHNGRRCKQRVARVITGVDTTERQVCPNSTSRGEHK